MITATFITSIVDLNGLPHDSKPQIAMVGRSNVGKSSMINSLTHRNKLARVSSEPGRTQTLNLYDIDDTFYLVDLPGYGYAKTSKSDRAYFAEIISDYLGTTKQLKLVLLIIDARIPFSNLDGEMIAWLQQYNVPFVIIMNKIDKVSAKDTAQLHTYLEEHYPGVDRIEHSSSTGKNRDAVWGAIQRAINDAE